MSASIQVAKRYATAIFELGVEGGSLETLVADVDRIADTFVESPELQRALEDPALSLEARRAVLREVCERLSMGQLAIHSVLYLLERRRVDALPGIARALRAMVDLKKGVVHAEVTAAAPLSQDFYTRLQAQLEKVTGKRVVIDRKEDPSLIAGVITRIGDTVYDGSLRAKLEHLKTALMPN